MLVAPDCVHPVTSSSHSANRWLHLQAHGFEFNQPLLLVLCFTGRQRIGETRALTAHDALLKLLACTR
jgi:hypothetical protein